MSRGEQAEHLGRVADRLRPTILAFATERGVGVPFFAEELHDFVRARIGAAPASADRVLRLCRAESLLNYRVLNRRRSRYVFTRIGDPAAAPYARSPPPSDGGGAVAGSSTPGAGARPATAPSTYPGGRAVADSPPAPAAGLQLDWVDLLMGRA